MFKFFPFFWKCVIAYTYPNHSRIPVRLQWYAQAIHNFPDLWASSERLKYHFTLEGHKDTYVTTIISYIQSLADLFYLTQMEIINASQLQTLQPCSEPTCKVNHLEIAVKTHIVNAIIAQHTHYYWQNIKFSLHSDDKYSDSDNEDINECNLNQPDLDHFNSHIQWQKPILITGKPSSGKLHTILACVHELIDRDVNILIASLQDSFPVFSGLKYLTTSHVIQFILLFVLLWILVSHHQQTGLFHILT